MTQPSADKLRAIIDITDEQLRLLKRFDLPTDGWSAFVCVVLLEKLDDETRGLWDAKLDLPEMPNLDALFKHMEQRIFALRNKEESARKYGHVHQASNPPSSGSFNGKAQKHTKSGGQEQRRHHPYDRKPQAADNQSVSKDRSQNMAGECLMCANGVRHFLWKCDSFRALENARQLEKVKQWGLCEACLIAKHPASECTKSLCPICKRNKHNSLLCSENKGKQVHHARSGRRRRPAAKTN